MEASAQTLLPPAWTIPWPFRDGAVSSRQIGSELTRLQADFARALAMSAWAVLKPLRLIVFGLPMHAALDDCLLACLRRAGWKVGGAGDALLAPCWDSRWEFLGASADAPARYRPGPSYNERLRLELLLDAWERASLQGERAADSLADALARASAEFSPELACPADLLRDVARERRAEAEQERRVRHALRDALAELPGDDIRHLAISGALDGWGDVDRAVRRHGTPALRAALAAFRHRAPEISARAELEPRLAELRRELWAPFVGAAP